MAGRVEKSLPARRVFGAIQSNSRKMAMLLAGRQRNIKDL